MHRGVLILQMCEFTLPKDEFDVHKGECAQNKCGFDVHQGEYL